jgi:hypothetical protein
MVFFTKNLQVLSLGLQRARGLEVVRQRKGGTSRAFRVCLYVAENHLFGERVGSFVEVLRRAEFTAAGAFVPSFDRKIAEDRWDCAKL